MGRPFSNAQGPDFIHCMLSHDTQQAIAMWSSNFFKRLSLTSLHYYVLESVKQSDTYLARQILSSLSSSSKSQSCACDCSCLNIPCKNPLHPEFGTLSWLLATLRCFNFGIPLMTCASAWTDCTHLLVSRVVSKVCQGQGVYRMESWIDRPPNHNRLTAAARMQSHLYNVISSSLISSEWGGIAFELSVTCSRHLLKAKLSFKMWIVWFRDSISHRSHDATVGSALQRANI